MNNKKYTIQRPGIMTQEGLVAGNIEKVEFEGDETMQVSDGYHTMDELYTHRFLLFIALCRHLANAYIGTEWDKVSDHFIWRSKIHYDGSSYDGWFILGIDLEFGKQITYHLPVFEYWDNTNFAITLAEAPSWDGHTAEDVLLRLAAL